MKYKEFCKKWNLNSNLIKKEFRDDLNLLVLELIKVGEQNYKNKEKMLGKGFDVLCE